MRERPGRNLEPDESDLEFDQQPDEVPSDEALDVEGPNESAPGHHPEREEERSQ